MDDQASSRAVPTEVVLRRARQSDLKTMCAIERASFPTPWSERLIAGELRQPDATYLVATLDDEVVGFIGLWHVLDDGHICTLAVDPQHRRRGLGELLVLAAMRQALEIGADVVHLEYRVGNEAAARLYDKLGFERVGVRERYYSDTGEDAVLARIDGITTAEGRARLDQAWERWLAERGMTVVAQ